MKYVIAVIFFFVTQALYAQNLFPVYKDAKWGYIDSTGKEILAPKYKVAGFFYEGMAYAAIPGEKMGFINTEGKNVITAKYDAATNFNEGFASVLEDEDWGVINTKGEMVIEAKYPTWLVFHDGLAKIKFERGLFSTYGFINTKGDTVIYPKFEKLSDFSNGLCMASKDGDTYGYIDTKGNWVIQPGRQIGSVIKINKEYVFSDKDFSEGLVAVAEKEKYGVIDKTGTIVIPAKFSMIGKFKNGLAPAKTDSLYGYINTKGNWIIKPKYINAEPFSNGLAAVSRGSVLDQKWGFIDALGKVTVPLTLAGGLSFTDPFLFLQGVAAAYITPGVWGYVNRQGKILWKNK